MGLYIAVNLCPSIVPLGLVDDMCRVIASQIDHHFGLSSTLQGLIRFVDIAYRPMILVQMSLFDEEKVHRLFCET